jgi:hypothetical protein
MIGFRMHVLRQSRRRLQLLFEFGMWVLLYRILHRILIFCGIGHVFRSSV